MNRILWALQVLLAIAFLAHGVMFLNPPAELVAQMNALLPRWFQLFLGGAEVAAAVGLTLPGLTGIQPWLVPCASGGVMIVLTSATLLHLARAEWGSALTTAVLLLLATVVTYARWRVAPIPARRTA